MARTKQTAKKSIEKAGKKPRVKPEKAGKSVKGGEGGVKKPHRFRPGTVATREIRRYQGGTKATALLLPKTCFERAVREVMAQYNPELRLQSKARANLQQAAEDLIVAVFAKANRIALNSRRVTIYPGDVTLACEDFSVLKSLDKKAIEPASKPKARRAPKAKVELKEEESEEEAVEETA